MPTLRLILCCALLSLLTSGASHKGGKKRIPSLSGGAEALQLLNEDAPGTALIPRRSCVSTPTAGYGPDVLVDCDFLDYPHNEAFVAVHPGNPNRVLTGANSYEFFLKGSTIVARGLNSGQVSSNGGATWTTLYVPLGAYNTASDPVFAFDTLGNGYAANIGYHTGQGGAAGSNGSIFVNKLPSGGGAWSAATTVYRGFGNVGSSIFNDKEWMTVDTVAGSPYLNNIYVTWTKFESGPGGAYLRSSIWFAKSTDGGASFWPALEISGSGSFCTTQVTGPANECDEDQFSVVTAGPGGVLYVAFQNTNTAAPDFNSQYLVVKSTNGGGSWSDPYKVANLVDGFSAYPLNADGSQTLTNVQYRISSAGNIVAAPSGDVYVIWADNSGTAALTNNDVRVSKSADGGVNWSAAENVNTGDGTSDQFYPWGAWNPVLGKLQIAYMDRKYGAASNGDGVFGITLATRNGAYSKTAVHSATSDANNSRWFGQRTRFLGDYIGLAIDSNGKANVAWTDMRRDVLHPSGALRKGQNTVFRRMP